MNSWTDRKERLIKIKSYIRKKKKVKLLKVYRKFKSNAIEVSEMMRVLGGLKIVSDKNDIPYLLIDLEKESIE